MTIAKNILKQHKKKMPTFSSAALKHMTKRDAFHRVIIGEEKSRKALEPSDLLREEKFSLAEQEGDVGAIHKGKKRASNRVLIQRHYSTVILQPPFRVHYLSSSPSSTGCSCTLSPSLCFLNCKIMVLMVNSQKGKD